MLALLRQGPSTSDAKSMNFCHCSCLESDRRSKCQKDRGEVVEKKTGRTQTHPQEAIPALGDHEEGEEPGRRDSHLPPAPPASGQDKNSWSHGLWLDVCHARLRPKHKSFKPTFLNAHRGKAQRGPSEALSVWLYFSTRDNITPTPTAEPVNFSLYKPTRKFLQNSLLRLSLI